MIVIFPQVLRLIGNGPARSVRAEVTESPDERALADATPKPGHEGGKPSPDRLIPASNQPPTEIVLDADPSGFLKPQGGAGIGDALTAVSTVGMPPLEAGGEISSHGHGFSWPLSGPSQLTLPPA